MKKYYLFDLGNVLINVNENLLPFEYFSKNQDWIDFESGKLDGESFFIKHPASRENFNKVFSLNTPVFNMLSILPKESIYFFSNTNPVHFNFLSMQYSFLKTNNLFLSFEVGYRKPEIQFYDFINQALYGNEIYFIDDRIENLSPIVGFTNWKTFCYKNNNSDLEKFLMQSIQINLV